MNREKIEREAIIVSGNDKMAFSLTVSLLKAGQAVLLYTENEQEAFAVIRQHAADLARYTTKRVTLQDLHVNHKSDSFQIRLAIAITDENLNSKLSAVQELEKQLPDDAVIAVNTESCYLSEIQAGAKNAGRIIGANWVEPVHTTCFLEIISNIHTHEEAVEYLFSHAQAHWKKDPYIAKCDYSIRARMMSALIREAFFLVNNGYVGFEDVDRACRNDAGYYLPFAGNFRYMDLMGTYIYGLVMKDMNPDLSKDRCLPHFFNDLITSGAKGMINKKGIYEYKSGEVERWMELSRVFSYQIEQIIEKYPFNDLEKKFQTEEKTMPVS